MINLDEVTKFDRTPQELEEFAIFSVLVAGKTAKTMVKCLDDLLFTKYLSPFDCILVDETVEQLAKEMRVCGIGCYNQKAKTLYQLVRANLNLRTCTVDDLEEIYGIAEKTSRFFLLHTRPNQQIAALDRHILHYMRNEGLENIPTNTPKGNTYKRVEQQFLELCSQKGKSAATLDLEIWYKYSKYKK